MLSFYELYQQVVERKKQDSNYQYPKEEYPTLMKLLKETYEPIYEFAECIAGYDRVFDNQAVEHVLMELYHQHGRKMIVDPYIQDKEPLTQTEIKSLYLLEKHANNVGMLLQHAGCYLSHVIKCLMEDNNYEYQADVRKALASKLSFDGHLIAVDCFEEYFEYNVDELSTIVCYLGRE